MSKTVKEIENAIVKFSQDQLRQFRAWYEKFDSEIWDKQIEKDVANGKLDAFANKAIADHIAGKSRKL